MTEQLTTGLDSDDQRERVLVAFTGDHAPTARLAGWLAKELDKDFTTELADLDNGVMPALADYDAVVIGAGVRIGRHPRSAINFLRDHRDELAAMPAAFFSVGGHGVFARDGYITRMTHRTGWQPGLSETFADAGELQVPDVHAFALRVADAVPDAVPTTR